LLFLLLFLWWCGLVCCLVNTCVVVLVICLCEFFELWWSFLGFFLGVGLLLGLLDGGEDLLVELG